MGNNIQGKIIQAKINQYKNNLNTANENKKILAEAAIKNNQNTFETLNAVNNKRINALNEAKRFSNWSDEVRSKLLYEFMMKIYTNCFSVVEDAKYDTLKKNLVYDFIKSEGSLNLLNKFKSASTFLSEVGLLIETSHKKMIKSVSPKDSDYVINTIEKTNYFDKMNFANVDGICNTIRSKVQDAIESFVTTNNENREKIAAVLQNAKNKIEGSKDDSIKESVNIYSNNKIRAIENAPTNLFGEMVSKMCSNLYKIPTEKRAMFTNESGGLNMETVVESCKVVYTFLEMLNTTRMHTFSANELSEFVENLAKQ